MVANQVKQKGKGLILLVLLIQAYKNPIVVLNFILFLFLFIKNFTYLALQLSPGLTINVIYCSKILFIFL